MEKIYITIDGGTTNTRINLVVDRAVKDSVKLSIGAGKAADNRALYINSIRDGIAEVLKKNDISEKSVNSIIASGMITSEYGLCNLPHICTPAGLSELHSTLYKTELGDISSIPFVFVRGVKSMGDTFCDTDIMRGEETELMGIINPDYGKCVYVLPGSHSKIIVADEKGRITNFSTMLTGEMMATLSANTILKDAVNLSETECDTEYLLKGYDFTLSQGINKALFKARILKNIFNADSNQIYSYFAGVVLCDEITCIIREDCENVVLAGKAQLKNAMADILKNRSNKKVTVLSNNVVDASTSLGAVRVFENKF